MKTQRCKVLLLVTIFCLIFGVWAVATLIRRLRHPAKADSICGEVIPAAAQKEAASAWVSALRAGDDEMARHLAGLIIAGDDFSVIADPWYESLFKQKKVHPRFLTDPFNRWDSLLWRHALFFHDEAVRITESCSEGEEIEKLFNSVIERLEGIEKADSEPVWPYRVWERGFGVCDRQAWVLCELAYQLGYEAMIIWLIDPDTGASPHTICEIRSSDGRVWLADPFEGILLAGSSLRDLVADPERAAGLWPKAPRRAQCLATAHVMLTAYPGDYCVRNQLLGAKLRDLLGASAPRFGDDPKARKSRYTRLAAERSGRDPEEDFVVGYYGHPFVLIHEEFKREAALNESSADE